jgi:microcystin degradation protein MlrC
MRIGIIAIQNESNTFLPSPTTLDVFRQGHLIVGERIRDVYGEAYHEIGGFFQGLDEAGMQAVPLLMAWAVPGGTIPAETLDAIVEMMFKSLAEAGPLDGLLVAPHGAAVSERHRDADGHWLSLLRQRVGPEIPIICTLDPHANVSHRMIDACNASITYRTNPHLDQRNVGLEAARLMVRTLRGEIKPTQAVALPPVAINIERQLTASAPCRPLYERADVILKRPGVLSDSIILGFPYADVAEMGSGFIVVTDNDPADAQRHADELEKYLFDHRDEFIGNLIEIDDAIEQAKTLRGPVCLLDMGDNVGGGSPADGTLLAHSLHRHRIKSLVCLYDPEAVAHAHVAGAGATVALKMGGNTDPLHGPPLHLRVTIRSFHEGIFTESQPRHGGTPKYDMGATAIVESESGLTLLLFSKRIPPFSLGQITSCGIRPRDFRMIVAKGVHAPVAAYAPVCPEMIRVNTPGFTTADMGRLNYRHRRRPLFPFESI